MIVQIIPSTSPGAAARIDLHSAGPKASFVAELPEDYRALAPHRILLAVVRAEGQDERLRTLVAEAVGKSDEIRIAFGRMTDDGYAESRVKLDAYRLAAGETTPGEAEAELRRVHEEYPEYSDPDYGGGEFEATVRRFASDDFYAHHHLAREYLAATGASASPDSETTAPPAP